MRAVTVAEDRRLVAVDRPAPEPGPGQVLVEVSYCGICGSDLHFREVPELFPAGTVPGHEFSGRIVAVGEGVDGWSAGHRVCVLPFGQCGECADPTVLDLFGQFERAIYEGVSGQESGERTSWE